MVKPKSNIIKMGYTFLAVDLLSSLLLILNTFYIQNAVIQYIGLGGLDLATGYVLFFVGVCIFYFIRGFNDLINNGWLVDK